jgi:surface polysaccharide O-acyltransferase-like enzyme
MLTGALLLQPYKVEEPLGVFFKKRLWRIGLPFLFWGGIYFAWSYYADHTALTLRSIGQGIVSGPYYQFWFLYMLIGLYLVTPLLRVLVARADRKVLRYFILLWFVGVAVVPLIQLASGYTLDSTVFVIGGWIGYFILGSYLLNVRLRSKTLYAILFAGFAWTVVGTYLITYFVGGTLQYFFYDFLSINVILASTALFMVLSIIPTDFVEKWSLSTNRLFHFPADYVAKLSLSANKLLHFISQSTLAIYLFHVIVLESLQRGYLGVRISIMTINPALEIPLVTVTTLVICVLLLYPVSKIPIFKKIIGISST